MKKLPFFITATVVLLLAGSYFAYQYLQRQPIKPWDLVPGDALLVYEKESCERCVDEVTASTIWKVLQEAAIFRTTSDTIQRRINDVLSDAKSLLVSVHPVKKDEFDFIYYISSDNDLVSLKSFSKSKGHSVANRAFSGVTINEVRFDKRVFSFANIEGVSFGSFTPFLVEDVIRTFNTNGEAGRSLNYGALQFASIKDDAGNLYVRLQAIDQLIALVTDEGNSGYEVGRSALLDIKADESSLTLNGFSTDSIDRANYFLSIFQHQNPVSFGLKNLISNRVVSVTTFGVNNGRQLFSDRAKFLALNRPRLSDSLNILTTRHALDVDALYEKISDEIAVCYFETNRKKFSKVALIETSEASTWLKAFSALGDKLSIDTVFYERYSDYILREVPVYRFSEKLLWPFVSGFDHTFYTSIGKTIVLAEDVETLKNFLDDVDGEETWSRSVSQNRFIEGTLLESNVSLYFNPWRFVNFFVSNFHPRWQSFVKENRQLLQGLQMSSIQFSHLNNSYYTNALFTFKEVVKKDKMPPVARGAVTVFDKGIAYLTAVKSHISRSTEVLVQDSLNDLSLVGADGKVLWKTSIGERIIGDVTQIDFFNNGKLQYFFATQFSMHIIDRLGNYVASYPMPHNISDMSFSSVVDYDNSKKYRFLLSDKLGKVYMFDKDGKLLEGWNPNDAGAAFSTSPRHYRIKGKDYVIGIRKDGLVYVWNRRGELLRNFPLKLDTEPMGDVYLERGNTLDETFFVIATRDGFRIRLTLEGKIHSKETLLKTSIRSTFFLVNEKGGKSYVICQQDERELTIMDADGKTVLSAPVAGAGPADVKFYDYGSGKLFLTARDNTQGLYYIYDGQGALLTTPPIESTVLEIRPSDSDEFALFFIHGRSLVIQAL